MLAEKQWKTNLGVDEHFLGQVQYTAVRKKFVSVHMHLSFLIAKLF